MIEQWPLWRVLFSDWNGGDRMLNIKWYGYIQNVDIRGRFLDCPWPNWPKSLLPLEYNLPNLSRNNEWTAPQAMNSTFDARDQSSCRGVNTYNNSSKENFIWNVKNLIWFIIYMLFFDAAKSQFAIYCASPAIQCHFADNSLFVQFEAIFKNIQDDSKGNEYALKLIDFLFLFRLQLIYGIACMRWQGNYYRFH